jgi:hypothetical protein
MHLDDCESIREFNARLHNAGIPFAFPANSADLMHRDTEGGDAPYQTAYVMSDGAAVRGGYILKHEQLFTHEGFFPAGNYQLPLSEGIIDRKYAIVGVQLIRDALSRQTALYSLGMGSPSRPLPQLLQRIGWTVSKVPFLFRVETAGTFTREIRWLRRRPATRCLLDLLRYTGVLAAYSALGRMRRRMFGARPPADVSIREVASFPGDIDRLFSRVRDEYGLLTDRRAAAMNKKLPPADARLSRLLLYKGTRLAGWVVFSRSQLRDHTQFGNMTLGCIVDGLGSSEDVPMLVAEACRRLEAGTCDLLVSNQSHPVWISALRRHGFLQGPSNFVLALSPDLAALAPDAVVHFTRADGDGPINL